MLSSRSRALLKLLLDSINPLRVKDIATQFGVSERTIKYDLDTLRSWLQEYDLELLSQPNKGIWIPLEPSVRNRIQHLLYEKDQTTYYYQQDRVKLIMLALLFEDSPIHIAKWMDQFQVSRNTIQSDLALVETSISEWQVTLRRTREGIQIVGSERQKRLVLEYAIHDSIGGSEMFQMVHTISLNNHELDTLSSRLENMFQFTTETKHIYEAVEKITRIAQLEMGISFSERMIIGIFIRLCIVIQRLAKHRAISLDETEILSVKKLKVFRVFQDVLNDLSVMLGINIPDQEAAYISLHAIGSLTEAPQTAKSFDLFQLTVQLVEALSEGTGVEFQQDPDLLYPLFTHITDKIAKYRHGVVEPNPLLQEIAGNYRVLFNYVKQISKGLFTPHEIFLTDSDIAYIVLHFQASLVRIEESKKHRVLVVCSTGRGMARLLKNKLEHSMKNVAVVGSCSVLEAEKMANRLEPDLLISILPIVSSRPVIVVQPIPTQHDFDAIRKRLEELPAARSLNTNHLLASLEQVTQDVLQLGLDLSKQVTMHFSSYLPDSRSEGLTYHILFMVNRLMFGTPYADDREQQFPVSEEEIELRDQLKQIFLEKGIVLPKSEQEAIFHYFVSPDKEGLQVASGD